MYFNKDLMPSVQQNVCAIMVQFSHLVDAHSHGDALENYYYTHTEI